MKIIRIERNSKDRQHKRVSLKKVRVAQSCSHARYLGEELYFYQKKTEEKSSLAELKFKTAYKQFAQKQGLSSGKSRWHSDNFTYGCVIEEKRGCILTEFLDKPLALEEFKLIFLEVYGLVQQYHSLFSKMIPFHSDHFWIWKAHGKYTVKLLPTIYFASLSRSNPYSAPEESRHKGKKGAKSTVYSLGILFFRALTGVFPWKGEMSNAKMFGDYMDFATSLSMLNALQRSIVQEMLSSDPASRTTLSDEQLEILLGDKVLYFCSFRESTQKNWSTPKWAEMKEIIELQQQGYEVLVKSDDSSNEEWMPLI